MAYAYLVIGMLAFPDLCFDTYLPLRSPELRLARTVLLEVLRGPQHEHRPVGRAFLGHLHSSIFGNGCITA